MNAIKTSKMSNFRWVICALLFLATTVNYMDRQVLSLTWKDFIAPEFHWTDDDYGTITGLFSIFYAIANLFAGKFVDWMGTKKGYLIAIFVWSTVTLIAAGKLPASPTARIKRQERKSHTLIVAIATAASLPA